MLTLLPLQLLTACNAVDEWRNPEVVACEDFLEEKLKAPATYKRVEFNKMDEAISTEQWSKIYKETAGVELDDMAGRDAKTGGVRTVLLSYDAENAMGTPLRGKEICYFLMKSFEKDEFFLGDPSALSSITDRAMWRVDQRGGEPACCLPSPVKKVIPPSLGGES